MNRKEAVRMLLYINLLPLGISAVYLWLVVPLLEKISVFGSSCLVHDIFHIYCPGCGGTRALSELLRFRFGASFLCNPLILLGSMILLFYDVVWTVILVKGRPVSWFFSARAKIRAVWITLLVITVLSYAVIRDVLLIQGRWDYLGDLLPYWTGTGQ